MSECPLRETGMGLPDHANSCQLVKRVLGSVSNTDSVFDCF